MKKVIYALLLPMVVVSGFVFANHQVKNEAAGAVLPKPPAAAEKEAALKQWEATPEGIRFKAWEASPAGQKVYASEAKISKSLKDYTTMEAVVTALALPPGSRLCFGVMARIDGDDYIVTFDAGRAQLEQLRSLKVADKIIIRSRTVSHAPKYAYPIVRADYVERDRKIIYKRTPRKGGC